RGPGAPTPEFGVGVEGASGGLLATPSLRVNYAARARLLLLAAIVFPRFVEVVGLGMQPFACSSPSKPFRPHGDPQRSGRTLTASRRDEFLDFRNAQASNLLPCAAAT